jgi:hypothetical protein
MNTILGFLICGLMVGGFIWAFPWLVIVGPAIAIIAVGFVYGGLNGGLIIGLLVIIALLLAVIALNTAGVSWPRWLQSNL